ncbi:unnamed protein product [Onchocerca flexuosa]|uniref:Uncharacterized protein n=1 Tax=Onchocerca flexuosa TaxID=387005 RepID=A0A3P7YY75_9BILA|nr:unnamed protein product [Onchocerca flexuosa]
MNSSFDHGNGKETLISLISGRKQSSSTNISEINSPQIGRNSTNFLPQSQSTPIFHPRTIPPLFESPESNQSFSLSLSLSSSSSSAKENEENWNESSNVSNTKEFICVTCEGNCCCNKKNFI